MISLLDTVDHYPLDAWVVFRNLPDAESHKWYIRPLREGFKHVEVWVRDRGVWIRMEPCFEIPVLEAYLEEPLRLVDPMLKPTFFRVRKPILSRTLKAPWVVGPVTCVEAVKLILCIRKAWVKTPYQLYTYLRKTKGV